MSTKIYNPTPKVTVAISAYNEEQNIQAFLKSTLEQKENGFSLEAIWVYDDGSTDKTKRIVKSFSSRKIILFTDTKRRGKSTRLNDIYTRLQSDILVQSDADIIMSHIYVIRDLIQPLLRKKTVGMCGGHTLPLPGTTFTEKAVNCTVEAYILLRNTLRDGNNIFSVDGRLLAYKKELVKKIHIPEDMTSNDKFTYFSCLSNGYAYRYVPSAIVFYRSPKTLKDQLRQEGRFACSMIKHTRYFPSELVKREKYIPRSFLIKIFLKQFIRHPLICSYIFFINAYCRYKAKIYEKQLTARWPIAYTTKRLS